ncbi:MAG: hypothetical protein NTV85_28490, partial [Hyphomicrobiales bacterium]|nr:hypothetical protein [Hyphomicrobiales bacterium]
MHVAPFFVGMALGCMAGVLIGCLAAEFILRGNKPATICRAALDGERCTRLALPGGRFCRHHEEFFRAQVSA